ncbi:peptide chain release factor N(5)-glutamine methyltransferase [Rhodohalobacter mucosus]|uniref:peptide chain release factor N(5)-glutamine methyltransferase n=1 Tax=Rhodohalobacter mucosus TaxID=2079485 RepID=A0A316TMJ6_9BACT|nr:peptide chain release factor N(5)-glutamine methyltransferase [Rhodohalobacter mucosus]PWN05833.1 peptide chain release factor N(5)-glutamine methyltransferase [Rhodohalobacter mucosus]
MSTNSDQVWTVLSMLEWGTGYLKKKGVDSARLSMEWLLAYVLDVRRLDIYLQFDRPLSPEDLETLRPLVKKRALHEPLQYITGSTEFLGCTIQVNPSVLIPRQETEQLTEIILERHASQKETSLTVLDIGTGSGCIPIAIKKHAPEWMCVGIDISEEALRTARSNAELNNTEVLFLKGDLFNLHGSDAISSLQPDIIISNPPYITHEEADELDPQVINYEPSGALFHDSPLQIYDSVANYASSRHAVLYLECNHKFAAEILDIVARYYSQAELIPDLDMKDRFIAASDSPK